MDSIILVHYIKFSHTNSLGVINHSITMFKERIIKGLSDKGIINLIVPIFEGSSRVECINPKLVSETEYKSALDAVNIANQKLDEWLTKTNHNPLTED